MTARNKNIPALRFKEFKGNWEVKKLSELLEFKNGINASKEQYGKGAKFINVLDILNNDFITHDAIIGSVDVEESILEKYPVNYGDILFQRSSETREEVGTANVYLDSKTATFGGFVIRGRKIGDYEPIFLNKLLKTDLSRNEITSKSGGSTRYNVGQETLSSVALPFPSLPEQQKIASFLSAIDEKIRQLTRRKAMLEQYKKGVMQQLFSGKLRFRDEKGKAYPKWEEKRLGDICETFKSGESITSKDIFEAGEFPVYGGNGLRGYTNTYTHDGFFALIGRQGALCGNINRVYGKSYISEHAIVVSGNEFSDTEWLAQRLDNMKLNRLSESSAQPGLAVNKLVKIKLNTPSQKEQQKIAAFLSSIDSKIESVTAQIERTKGYKKGLLQKMFV